MRIVTDNCYKYVCIGISVVMDSNIDKVGQSRNVELEITERRELVSGSGAIHKSQRRRTGRPVNHPCQ